MGSKSLLRYEHRDIMAHSEEGMTNENNLWYVEPFTFEEKS